MAEVVLKDGSRRAFADGCTLGEAVAQISNSLAKKVLVAKVNGNVTDLRMPLVNGSAYGFPYYGTSSTPPFQGCKNSYRAGD